jgi:hypothetical protein
LTTGRSNCSTGWSHLDDHPTEQLAKRTFRAPQQTGPYTIHHHHHPAPLSVSRILTTSDEVGFTHLLRDPSSNWRIRRWGTGCRAIPFHIFILFLLRTL